MKSKKIILLALILAIIIIVVSLLFNRGYSLSLKNGVTKCSKLYIGNASIQIKYPGLFESADDDTQIRLYKIGELEKKDGGAVFVIQIMRSQGDGPTFTIDQILKNSLVLPGWKHSISNFNNYTAILTKIPQEPNEDLLSYKIPYENQVINIIFPPNTLSPKEKSALQKVIDNITFSKSDENNKETYVSKCGLFIK